MPSKNSTNFESNALDILSLINKSFNSLINLIFSLLVKSFKVTEPLFVPAVDARQEDDGYILEVVYNAFDHKSELQIYRADDIENQVCNLKLKHHVPHQFHGFFTPEVFPY